MKWSPSPYLRWQPVPPLDPFPCVRLFPIRPLPPGAPTGWHLSARPDFGYSIMRIGGPMKSAEADCIGAALQFIERDRCSWLLYRPGHAPESAPLMFDLAEIGPPPSYLD